MSSKPLNRKKLGFPCAAKVRHNTFDQAVASAVVRTESHRNPPDALLAYQCPHCRGYHLTSRVEGQDKRWPVITVEKILSRAPRAKA